LHRRGSAGALRCAPWRFMRCIGACDAGGNTHMHGYVYLYMSIYLFIYLSFGLSTCISVYLDSLYDAHLGVSCAVSGLATLEVRL